jgi:hypothetical protein
MRGRSPSLGILHTSPATVDLFGRLVREALPGTRIVNVLDDSILPDLRDRDGDLTAVEPRWTLYARTLADRDVDLILNACSSIGELCGRVAPLLPVDIVRVDAAMAREAVARAGTVGVAATLKTTLRPTVDLIKATARDSGREVEVHPALVEGAYEALMAGDGARHDALIRDVLEREAGRCEVVVLAQASMARVAETLDPGLRGRILASPPFAVADVVARLRALEA